MVALEALNVSLLRLGDEQLLAQRREAADDVAERPGGARGLGGEDLEQVADVDQPARALPKEELARDDAALVEDARVEATERLARRGRVPGKETGEERMIALGGGRGREIGQREPEERRQPGAQALGRIARVDDGAQEIADLARFGRGIEALLVVDDGGDAAGAERAGDGLRLDPGSRQHEDVTAAQPLRARQRLRPARRSTISPATACASPSRTARIGSRATSSSAVTRRSVTGAVAVIGVASSSGP